MRKLLLICGVLIGLGGVAAASLVHYGMALDSEAAAYVDTAFPAITSQWNDKELTARATLRLQKSASAEKTDRIFSLFKDGLGPLVTFQRAKGSTFTAVMTGHGTITSGRYAIAATFQKGSAEVDFYIIKVNGRWQIDGFYVKSNSLMENLAGEDI
jgi:hypothetical protein